MKRIILAAVIATMLAPAANAGRCLPYDFYCQVLPPQGYPLPPLPPPGALGVPFGIPPESYYGRWVTVPQLPSYRPYPPSIPRYDRPPIARPAPPSPTPPRVSPEMADLARQAEQQFCTEHPDARFCALRDQYLKGQ